jgi:hypothetical protein
MRTPVTIEASIEVEYVALDALLRWPGNPKQHDLGAIAASMLRFGFRDPIGVNRRNSYIEEGHGRLEVLQYLQQQGRTAPRFVRVDGETWLVPVLYFDDDEVTQRGYALAHNRTQELGGGYDQAALLDALEEQARHGMLPGTGFDTDDIEALQRRLAAASDQSATSQTQFHILIVCDDEPSQLELLERFQAEGLRARPYTVA